MTHFFMYFLSCNCLWYSFLYLKNVKIRFQGVPLWFILVFEIPEFWRWKLWNQNFLPFDSGNIHINLTVCCFVILRLGGRQQILLNRFCALGVKQTLLTEYQAGKYTPVLHFISSFESTFLRIKISR